MAWIFPITPMLSLLFKLKQDKLLSDINYQFAKLIHDKQQGLPYTLEQKNLAVFLAALVSFNVLQGHSCICLDDSLYLNPFKLDHKRSHYLEEIWQKIGKIQPLEWQNTLHNHIAFSHNPENIAPLLFQHNRLYFYRYWQAESRIALKMQTMATDSLEQESDTALNTEILNQLFPIVSKKIDKQKVAVATALRKNFSLISGGPGTGKTYTVAMLLAAIQLKQIKQGFPPLNIALAAPTGKAAARLKESINNSLQRLDNLPETLKQCLPTKAVTIHSLLGIRPNKDLPMYHHNNPLHFDLLVVDEASMIDLFLLEKLLNALKPSARLILLGDKDQLASVEAGNAIGELGQLLNNGYSKNHSAYLSQTTGYQILSSSEKVPAICDSLCHLTESRRFGEHSGIGQLAEKINEKKALQSWQVFNNAQFSDLNLVLYPTANQFPEKAQWVLQCVKLVIHKTVELYRPYLELVQKRAKNPQAVSVSEIFATFQKVRFLSALRVGELGVERLNQTIAEALQQAHLIHFRHSRENYLGKPILITENSPQNHVFSGDIGLLLPDEQGNLRVYFETQHDGQHWHLSPTRLPNYEPAYVMTVHKSQGSEFEHTLMIMPLSSSPVLTKELLYTAVTRAKQHFTLFGEEHIWKNAVKTDIQRQSGLQAQLLTQLQ